MQINATIKNLGQLHCPDAEYGDIKLNVFPIEHKKNWLPPSFQPWEHTLDQMLEHVPYQEGATQHYVTIDSKFFTLPDTLRREGIHLDGNFCADPNFNSLQGRPMASWGGDGGPGGTWAGLKYNPTTGKGESDWVMPYDIEIPIADYISDSKGGILCTSSIMGCVAWKGQFEGNIKDGGNFEELEHQLQEKNKVEFNEHQLYFMSSNTPHESIMIDKGVRRTFIRLTLDCEYDNSQILNTQTCLENMLT